MNNELKTDAHLLQTTVTGSGTTGIACINTNRNYILIEKEKNYIDIINERIKNYENSNR